MPNYAFVNVKTGKSGEFFFTMKEAPKVSEIVEIDGEEWKRVFTVPQAAPNGLKPIDPHSQKAFREKTGAMKGGTIGDLWDYSKEQSERRAEKEGRDDPVREKFFKEYKKKRRGTPHTAELAANQKKAQKKLNDSLTKIGKELGLAP